MNQLSVLKDLFPRFPEDVLKERQTSFMTKMKFVDYISRDVKFYHSKFPHLSPEVIRSYYYEFLENLEEEHANKMVAPYLLPFRALMSIFRHLDFIDLMNYAVSNLKLYRHVTAFPYIKKRLEWEREHSIYINDKLRAGANDALPYGCLDPVEQTYKNHVVLKRNLYRIRPHVPYGKERHKYNNFASNQVFNMFFRRLHKDEFANNDMFKVSAKVFRDFGPEKKEKYEHAALVARKYGFVFCFKGLNWWFPENMATTKEVLEAAVNDHQVSDEVMEEYRIETGTGKVAVTLKTKGKKN